MLTLTTAPPVYKCINLGSSVAAAYNGTAVPVAGYKQAIFTCVTDNGAGGTTTFKIQDSTDGSTGWNDVTGATTAAIADTDDNEGWSIVLKDLHANKGYLRVVATVATQTATALSAHAVLFGGRDDDAPGTNAAVVV